MSEPEIRTSTYPLFVHMEREHGLTLTESEMNEIVHVVRRMDKDNPLIRKVNAVWMLTLTVLFGLFVYVIRNLL